MYKRKQKVNIPSADVELCTLSIAFNTMHTNLTEKVHNIENNFRHTNESVTKMRDASSESAQHSEMIRAFTDDLSKRAESAAISIQQTASLDQDATSLAEEVQIQAGQSKEKSQHMVEHLESSK